MNSLSNRCVVVCLLALLGFLMSVPTPCTQETEFLARLTSWALQRWRKLQASGSMVNT